MQRTGPNDDRYTTNARSVPFASAAVVVRVSWWGSPGAHRLARSGDLGASSSLGRELPAVDLDFLLTEIHVGEPVALVEYKHFGARPINPGSAVFTALRKLADRAAIPFLVAWYWPASWAFRIRPLNDLARDHFEDSEDLTERAYVQRLYRLRRLTLARSLSNELRDVLPPIERRQSVTK